MVGKYTFVTSAFVTSFDWPAFVRDSRDVPEKATAWWRRILRPAVTMFQTLRGSGSITVCKVIFSAFCVIFHHLLDDELDEESPGSQASAYLPATSLWPFLSVLGTASRQRGFTRDPRSSGLDTCAGLRNGSAFSEHVSGGCFVLGDRAWPSDLASSLPRTHEVNGTV